VQRWPASATDAQRTRTCTDTHALARACIHTHVRTRTQAHPVVLHSPRPPIPNLVPALTPAFAQILSAFGDIALVVGDKYTKYLDAVLRVLKQAMQLSIMSAASPGASVLLKSHAAAFARAGHAAVRHRICLAWMHMSACVFPCRCCPAHPPPPCLCEAS